jgi:starch synthase
MRILLASSEIYPYSKTGGLADMVGALAKTLGRLGHEVGVVTPLYMGIRERFPALKPFAMPLDFALGTSRVQGEVWALESSPGVTIYFIDQPGFYQRPTLYQRFGMDYPDNAERFIFFSKAAAHLAFHLPWKPELLHVHDWQAGPAALLTAHQRKLPSWSDGPRTCLTIHNLAYQGVFPAGQYALLNLPWDYYFADGVEFYGQLNCLKAGIAYSDMLTTVSPRYAREITTEALGAGLDGLLRHRQSVLRGILNGVDYEEWNTSHNIRLPFPYSAEDLAGKAKTKAALQRELGLRERPDVPLFGSIGRLVEQKGVNIMLGALEEMVAQDFQFILLGTGSAFFEQAFRELAERHPGKIAVRIGFEESLSHRIEAGCDFFLMPSRFEPCGLNQMYSLRYGTIPIVHRTGGLDDTVVDIREIPENADGIKFDEHTATALAKAVSKALALYGEPKLLAHYRKNGMRADFSWERTAEEFVKVYDQAVNAP